MNKNQEIINYNTKSYILLLIVKMNFYILVTLVFIKFSFQCELNGKIEGQCLDTKVVKEDLHFCSKVLHGYTCIPYSNVLFYYNYLDYLGRLDK